MARYGINPQNTLGVSMPVLRGMAREIKRDHALAIELWESGIHEARILAALAVHDKKAPDSAFEPFFPLILGAAKDDRNFVKKAVNWALRGLGKRNQGLNTRAIETAQQIATLDSKAARWIAADALRELTGEKVQSRLSDSS